MVIKKNGFTLIELLVAIAIIALLLAILMPSLAKVKKVSRRVVCMTNLRSLGQVFHSYASENQDKVIEYMAMDTGKHWFETMIDHCGDDSLLLCPEATKTPEGLARNMRHGSNWFDPDFDFNRNHKYYDGAPDRVWMYSSNFGVNAGIEFTGSYGTNGWVHSESDFNARENFRRVFPPDFMDVVEEEFFYIGTKKRPEYSWGGRMSDCNSGVPLALDCVVESGFPLARFKADAGEPLTKAEMEDWCFEEVKKHGEMNCFCFDRHDKHINTVFMDGSTRPVKVEELWLLSWTRDFPRKNVTIEW
jgi:prepilin-type N-terminal cleavage/methylation domain-containing protein